MACYVDHVVHASENSEVAIRGLDRAVTGEIRPVTPVFALGILVVLLVVLRHKTVAVAIDGLKDSRPGISNTYISRLAGSAFYFFAFFIKDHRIDPRQCWSSAARLHRIDGRFGAAKETASLRLPPRVDDDRFAFADDLVIPLPYFRLNRFAHGRHVLEVVVVFRRLVRPGFAQHADRCRRGMEDVYI